MKRLLSICALFLGIAIISSAQNLSIKGVTVDGEVTEFVHNLEAQGFKFSSFGDNRNGTANYSGYSLEKMIEKRLPIPMYGTLLDSGVILAIYYTRTSHLVYDVEVMFCSNPSTGYVFSQDFASAKLLYEGIKIQLKKKYNEPFAVTETRAAGSSPKTIQKEICTGETKYSCGFMAAPLGEVILKIGNTENKINASSPYPDYSLCVIMDYVNVGNNQKRLQEAEEQYQSEI